VIRGKRSAKYLCLTFLALAAGGRALAADFRFDRDTLSFTNSTVFEYHEGRIQSRKSTGDKEKSEPYTRRCFVMSRTVLQFYKFARFDRHAAPLDDVELAKRVRVITKMHPWNDALPEQQRVLLPGYANLRELSKARARVLQQNLGLGWPTYWRIGNFRMFFRRDDDGYQVRMHEELNAALDRRGFFVAYLSDYPHFHINHAVLVYGRKGSPSAGGIEHYLTYDPNHSDAPRELKWSPALRIFNFEKDEEFVGGFTRVYQIYGRPWQ
jgi:hypothetical protein